MKPQMLALVVGLSAILCLAAVTNLDLFAKQLSNDGCLTAAISCYQLMTGLDSFMGIRDTRLANAWTDLSVCYSKVPRWREAMQAQQQAIDIRGDLQGATHPSVVLLQANLAKYKAESGDFAGAESTLKGLLAVARKRQPPEFYSLAYALGALEDCYMQQKKYAEAEAVARQIADIDETIMANFDLSFDGRERLAEVLAKQGRLAEAEAAVRESLVIKEHLLKPDSSSIAFAHETLGKVLLLDKKKEAASAEFGKAMQILEAKYGPTDVKCQYWRARYTHLLTLIDPFNEQK